MKQKAYLLIALLCSFVQGALAWDGSGLTTLTGGLYLNFVRATETQMEKYKEEADAFHGGNAEDDTIDTGISDKDASEPSRARQL